MWCDRWVGNKLPDETTPLILSEEELRWHRWVESGVGELLAVAPRLSSPLSRNNIAVSVEKVMNGNQLALARRLQVTQASVWKWLEGGSVPQLGTLLRICFRLDVSPLTFLTGEIETISHQTEHEISQPMKKLQTRPYKRFDTGHMQSILEAALRSTDEPPLSMADITRALGYDQANFRKYFPELCRAISKRFLDYLRKKRRERIQKLCEEVRQVTLSLHAQGCYPGNRQVAKLLSKPTSFMEPEVQRTWRQTVKELGVKPMR
jgi:transcriptional regulator with XRE-family HTH domain